MKPNRSTLIGIALAAIASAFPVAADERDSFAQRMRPCVA